MAQDDLRARIAAMRRRGMSDQEIARALQAERNATRGPERGGAPARPGVPAMASAIGRQGAESTSSVGYRNLRTGPEAQESDLGAVIRGIPRAAAQGVLMGGYDELEGRVRSLLPGRTYPEEVARVRGEMSEFREEHPWMSNTAEFGSALIPVGAVARGVTTAAKAAKGGLTLGRQVLRGTGAGVGLGGLAGALSADPEGDASFIDALTRRVAGGTTGALFGGALGGTVPVAARVAARPIASVIRRLDDLRDDASRVWRSEVGAVGRGVGEAADREALEGLALRGETAVPDRREAEALARRFFGGKYGRDEKFALEAALRRVERDGIDLQQALQEVSDVTAGERPFVVADVGGRSTRRLGAAAEAMPSTGTTRVGDFFDTRIENRPDRMARDIVEGTGANRVNLVTRADEIAAERQPFTEALYDAAAESPRVKLTEGAREALVTPEGRRAIERAERANIEAQATRGRKPLEPVTRTEEVTELVPLGRADRIEKQVSKADGRVTYVGGNPKFATASTQRLEALYQEQLERIERSARLKNEGARAYTRETTAGKWSGFLPTNEYGRGIQMGNVAERQARELEAELVGRYQAMDPEEFAARKTRVFGGDDGAEPIWTEWHKRADDLADDVVDDAPDWVLEGTDAAPRGAPEVAPPQMREVVTGAREVVKDEVDLATLDAFKKQLDRRIQDIEDAIEKGQGGDPDLLASLVSNRDEVVRLMEEQSPVYATAKGYARDTALRQEGTKLGKELGALRMTPDEVLESVRALTPENALRVPGGVEGEIRDAAATRWAQDIGAGQGVERIVGGSRSARAGRPELSRRVSAVFGDDAASELGRRFDLERRMAESERAITGSRTVPLGLDVAELAEGAAPSGAAALEALVSPGRALFKAGFDRTIRPLWNRGVVGLNTGRADAIGRLLLGGQYGPEDLRMALQLLSSRREREANALARALRVSGLGAAGLGRASGS